MAKKSSQKQSKSKTKSNMPRKRSSSPKAKHLSPAGRHHSRSRQIEVFDRVQTGITGLDSILNGGFLKGGTYLLLGAPGTGKTIFANQVCFNQTAQGGHAVYVTLLAESHTRMFGNLQQLRFFDSSKVSSGIQYLSGYSILEKEGLDGLLRMLRDLVYQHGANLLFIDGIASADELSGSTVQFKKFVHHLNSVIGIAGCTTFLLSSQTGDRSQPEYTMVDGIVELTFTREGMKTARQIEVRKFRGSSHLYGQHFMEITEQGIAVYPRIEALYGRERTPVAARGRFAFGIKELDQMLKGGVTRASVTSLLGPIGCGKTQMAMGFLRTGAELGERSMLLSLYEHPERLVGKFANLNQPLEKHIKSGLLTFHRRDIGENLVDKTFSLLFGEIEALKIKRLVIDGIQGFRTTMIRADRLGEIITAALHELRARGITVVMVEETDLVAESSRDVLSYHSAITDNVIYVRHVELEGRNAPILNIIKTRDSAHDSTAREVLLSSKGFRLGDAVSFIKSFLPVVRRVGDVES